MSGIYIHIPFCKQKCNYCDFYKETALKDTSRFTEALQTELRLRADYLNSASVHTVYFGGGTPSVLKCKQFTSIFKTLYQNFNISADAEITLEANPDDLTLSYLNMLREIGFNRLSIGIQSFDDNELKSVNRRHTSQQAIQAVKDAREAGFTNISVDLIYGLPGQTFEKWKENLKQVFELKAEHISAYGLSYEEGTVLWKKRNKGLIKESSDELMLQMYRYMLQQMSTSGYEAYEISNFAKPGYRSRHNSSYWAMIPFLGAGPSAHSYDGKSRQWNIPNLQKYMEKMEVEKPEFEKEELSENDAYNDYIMVRLRTREGVSLEALKDFFGEQYYGWCMQNCTKFINSGHLHIQKGWLFLSVEGIEISNTIIAALMKTD